jgi:2-iminobutanoate/2-iminopropanoate deaminase
MSGRTQIQADSAPSPIAPYSQAIVASGLIYTAGQIGLDPATSEMVVGDVRAQAEQVMRNLAAVLGGAGAGWADVLKVTVYLVDIRDGAVINELFERDLPKPYPARTTVAVAALPRGALVEIECVAQVGADAG